MKVLAGVNTKYTGSVTLKGEAIVCASIDEQRARGVSIIFQEMNLLKNLTVCGKYLHGKTAENKSGKC